MRDDREPRGHSHVPPAPPAPSRFWERAGFPTTQLREAAGSGARSVLPHPFARLSEEQRACHETGAVPPDIPGERCLARRLLPRRNVMHIDRILFATDFSKDSALALDLAKETARRFGADVIVLHVDEGREAASPSAADLLRRRELHLALERIRDDLARERLPATTLLRTGDPAREIVRVATQTAGMIVLGTHGWTRSGGLLLGSVVDRVLRHAPLPVLTVRHPDRSAALSAPPAARTTPGPRCAKEVAATAFRDLAPANAEG